MSKNLNDQILDIKSILKNDTASYCIKGKTFPIKDDLEAWGWFWNNDMKYWQIDGIEENDQALTYFRETKSVWIEKI